MRTFLGMAAVVMVSACATIARGNAVQARLDEPFRLAQGQVATVADARLAVRFTRVEEDSRCPVDVQCIRAGEARVRLELRLPGREPQDVILATEGAQPRFASYDAYDVHLMGLEPQPRTNVPNPAYVAVVSVVRR